MCAPPLESALRLLAEARLPRNYDWVDNYVFEAMGAY